MRVRRARAPKSSTCRRLPGKPEISSRARLADFGNRILRNETDAFLFTTGLKGENVAGKWNFDTAFSYSTVRDRTRNLTGKPLAPKW